MTETTVPVEPAVTRQNGIFDYTHWQGKLPQLSLQYKAASPYPHIVLDNFLQPEAIEKLWEEFPRVTDAGWIHYLHVNEKKHGLNKMDLLPPYVRQVIKELSTPAFLEFVSKLTGIPQLHADETLEGGGLHQSLRGGFLNVHTDFSVHPHKRNWRRRVNLLIYVNKHWEESFGGNLELWSKDMKACVQSVSPIFNRCVFFNTDDDSYHGVPEPINCPDDESRKSIALYYFTEEKVTPKLRTTNYRARPKDGMKSVLIYMDKTMINVYTHVKRRLGINDTFISKVLNFFSGKK